MVKIKCEKELTPILSNLNNSLEVVDGVNETQRQVGEKSEYIIRRLKGQTHISFLITVI